MVTQGEFRPQSYRISKCLYYLQACMFLNLLANFWGDYIFFKLFFLPLTALKEPTERTTSSIKAKQGCSPRGYLSAETTPRASVIFTETYSGREHTWSQCRRICSCLYCTFKCLLNAYEGFSDSKSLRAGRSDINIYICRIYTFCIIHPLPPLLERPV